MEDRDFLKYFTQLGSARIDQIQTASRNIVATLLAIDTTKPKKQDADETAEEAKTKKKAADSLRQKYNQGDLGDKVNADLNYSLKRLVRGVCSENHTVKQGFFIASVMVFNRFSNIVDFDKLIAFIQEETKTNSSMNSTEIHAACMGRVLCMSALIESRWPINTKQLMTVIDIASDVYHQQDFLKEAV